MAKYKIGITEAGDAGIDLSWTSKMNQIDGAILITKCVSPDFYDAALKYKDKVIIHTTFTGFGHSVLEPFVPAPYDEFDAITTLVGGGFPKSKIVVRIDPIIPTKKGIETAKNVFLTFIDHGFNRFRISLIDMYPHVRRRFKNAGLPLPYGENGFAPGKQQIAQVDQMLRDVKSYFSNSRPLDSIRIESCAEPGLTETIQCGCISSYDLELLGLHDDNADQYGFQRKNCMCYSGKMELLNQKHPCAHQCLYCYWRYPGWQESHSRDIADM